MKPVSAVVIGAGPRGTMAYAPFALKTPHKLKIVGVAELDQERRENFKNIYNLSDEQVFSSAEELFGVEKFADCAIVCTNDTAHFNHAIVAIEKGYHLMLEKPMAVRYEDCIEISKRAKEKNRILSVAHVLRYANFFSTLKSILDEGRIGKIISIQHNENVGHWHYAHSYVRGNWRNSEKSSPMILAKSCHDLDVLRWLADSPWTKISSFGTLSYFKKENAPVDAPNHCLDGCMHENDCPYHAGRVYLNEDIGWMEAALSIDKSIEGRTKAVKKGPYGRCVYRSDNDVVDHQVVNIEFENNITAAFTMCAFTNDCSRTIKIMGTKGEIRGHMEKNEIEVVNFNSERRDIIEVISQKDREGHGGGDLRLISNFVDLIASGGKGENRTSADISLESHQMAFAAEYSRVHGVIIEKDKF